MSSSGSGTGGGEPASAGGATAGASLSAEGGLFASSPLRQRFRTGRRGSTGGWSSSNSVAAAAAAGDGERGVGAGPSTLLGKLLKVRLCSIQPASEERRADVEGLGLWWPGAATSAFSFNLQQKRLVLFCFVLFCSSFFLSLYLLQQCNQSSVMLDVRHRRASVA